MTKRELQAALIAAGLTNWSTRKVYAYCEGLSHFAAEDPGHEWTVWWDDSSCKDVWAADYVPRQGAGMDWSGRGDNIKDAMRSALQQSIEGAERIAVAVTEAHQRAQEYLS